MTILESQVAVVTGASSGIGKAIALGLAARGTALYLVGRRSETLEAVAGAAKEKSPQVFCSQADLTQDREVKKLLAEIKKNTESVDILIHSAGIVWLGELESTDVEHLDDHYKTNVRAPYILTQGLLPCLKKRHGQILFVNSSAGLTARANASQYAASKHALKAIADSLREEVNPYGVRVLSLFLGRTASPMQATVFRMEGKTYHPELLIQPEDVADVAVHALSLPRGVEVTEISMRPLLKSY
jgi:short-subunit dehydrogenase